MPGTWAIAFGPLPRGWARGRQRGVTADERARCARAAVDNLFVSRPVSPAAKQSTARSAMWCQRGRRVAIMIADFNGSKRKLNGCGGPSWQEARLDWRVSGKPGGGTNHGGGLLWEGPMTGPMPQGPSPTRTSQHGSACFRQYRGSQWLSGCAVARRPPSSGHPDDPSGREWAPCRPVPEQTAWDPAIQRQTLAPTARLRGAVAR